MGSVFKSVCGQSLSAKVIHHHIPPTTNMLLLFPTQSMKKIPLISFLQSRSQKHKVFPPCNPAVVPEAVLLKPVFFCFDSKAFCLLPFSPLHQLKLLQKLGNHPQKPTHYRDLTLETTCRHNCLSYRTHATQFLQCCISLLVPFCPSDNCLAPNPFLLITLSSFYTSINSVFTSFNQ